MEKKILIIFSISFLLIYVIYIFIKPNFHNDKDKYKILMAGRSTMALWFKHWNWPYPLRIRTTYRNWPIKYKKYSKDKCYLKYFEIPGPIDSKDNSKEFGKDILLSLKNMLTIEKYDALFFKYCFVDFIIEEKDYEKRLNEIKRLISQVRELTKEKNMKVIIGNALPLPDPNGATLKLQKEYNQYLIEVFKDDHDVLIFDLFTPLTNNDGKMNMLLAKNYYDHHPGEKAFDILDKMLFVKLNKFLPKKSN